MRNRSIPFGYRYQNGVLAVHPQESQTVRAVFAAYLSGEPLSKIAARLTAKLVEYLPGRWQWDKAQGEAHPGQHQVHRMRESFPPL